MCLGKSFGLPGQFLAEQLNYPQCYIGHRSLFQTIALFQKTYPGASEDEFQLVWTPFYRDRSLPAHGVPLEDRLVSAFGTERTGNEISRVQRIGRAHGISFNFKGLIGHTRDCHRLVQFVGSEYGADKQKDLIERIYFEWFEVGGDITSQSFLLDCAAAVHLDKETASKCFENGAFAEHVDQLDAEAREEGISSIPTILVNGTVVEGAEDVSTFYKAFVGAKNGCIHQDA